MSEALNTVKHSTQPRVRRRGTINYAEPSVRQADDSNVDQTALALTMLAPFAGPTTHAISGALRAALLARRLQQQPRDPNPFAGSRSNTNNLVRNADGSVDAFFEPLDYEMFQHQLSGPSTIRADAMTAVAPEHIVAPHNMNVTRFSQPGAYGSIGMGDRYGANFAASKARNALSDIEMQHAEYNKIIREMLSRRMNGQ